MWALVVLIFALIIHQSRQTYIDDVISKSEDFGYSSYNGPQTWPRQFPGCRGSQQSPINIVESECIQDSYMPPLRWKTYNLHRQLLQIKNTWHTVEVTFKERRNRPLLCGGPLDGEYVLSQVHFHWASEHALQNRFYGMEVHMVHYNTKYGTIERASMNSDGLAVVAMFLKEVPNQYRNRALNELVYSLASVRQGNTSRDLEPSAMTWLWNADLFSEYYTYQGSLTTPPCTEVVTWIIAKQNGYVGHSQIGEFQKLRGHDGPILTNKRNLQPLGDREITHYSKRFIDYDDRRDRIYFHLTN